MYVVISSKAKETKYTKKILNCRNTLHYFNTYLKALRSCGLFPRAKSHKSSLQLLCQQLCKPVVEALRGN